jgi:hypothetical protein
MRDAQIVQTQLNPVPTAWADWYMTKVELRNRQPWDNVAAQD